MLGWTEPRLSHLTFYMHRSVHVNWLNMLSDMSCIIVSRLMCTNCTCYPFYSCTWFAVALNYYWSSIYDSLILSNYGCWNREFSNAEQCRQWFFSYISSDFRMLDWNKSSMDGMRVLGSPLFCALNKTPWDRNLPWNTDRQKCKTISLFLLIRQNRKILKRTDQWNVCTRVNPLLFQGEISSPHSHTCSVVFETFQINFHSL